MQSDIPARVSVREVGLRDGLQSITETLSTTDKCTWLAAEHSAGVREVEVGSFVPARLLPQLADTQEVLAFAQTLPGLKASVLVPNLRGAMRALQAGAHALMVPVSASLAHSLANLRRTPEETVQEFARIRAARDAGGADVALEAGISTAFGCTLEGEVQPKRVLRLIQMLLDVGAERISLADTVGYADPAAVSRLFEAALGICGDRLWSAHFHDTRGLALANVHAALQLGINRFDASLGGIGGCPHAPGASGNVSTEDLVYMLGAMGCRPGIDLVQLLNLRVRLSKWLPDVPLHGALARAGLPRGWHDAASATSAPPAATSVTATTALPLTGLRVLEFSHMVMGPVCGMILADLGAEVIKIEPPGGDKTRTLPGLGCGFYRSFNRNKKSVVLDLHAPATAATVRELIGTSDVLLENFRPGMMAQLGLDYSSLRHAFPRLIYASHKGFLPGPYEQRAALDEVVQMMGGLAYMTGPPGRPLRAGSSVNDIMGGMFGAIGVLAALWERARTGRGQEVQSALFENCVFLCAQHLQQFQMSGDPPAPMPARAGAWGVYDVFTLSSGEQLFVAATSDKQFRALCEILGRPDLANDPALATNAQRVAERARLIATLSTTLSGWAASELLPRLAAAGLPYAPIVRPDQLLDDVHLRVSGALAPMGTGDGGSTQVVLLPLLLGGRRVGVQRPLARIGEHTREILGALRAAQPGGFDD